MRNVAVTYLGIVRDSPQKEVAGLITALADPEAAVRQARRRPLSAYGLDAEPAIPALQEATATIPTTTSSAKPAGRWSTSRIEGQDVGMKAA